MSLKRAKIEWKTLWDGYKGEAVQGWEVSECLGGMYREREMQVRQGVWWHKEAMAEIVLGVLEDAFFLQPPLAAHLIILPPPSRSQ